MGIVRIVVTGFGLLLPSVSASDPALDAAVRDTLLRNPEIILEALALLEARDVAAQVATDRSLIEQNAAALFGDKDGEAPVLVEFIDYQCSYCRQAEPQVQALLAREPGTVRRVLQFPILGEASVQAALVMEALRQVEGEDAYLTAHHALMSGDRRELQNLPQFLLDQGFDPAPILAMAEDESIRSQITTTHGLARTLGISGTPGFVTSTVIIRGYADVERLEAALTPQDRGLAGD
ncbi:thioredoxin domain-containing protein [Loktanella sp. IMCC34160]|uniref:DsbA family protein n=1 Tax=Loktanella sp. IMCC34160 TaxID=2510646 RepID=UPI0026D76D19